MKAHYTQLIWSWHLCAVVESSSCVSSSGAPTTTTTNSTSNNNTSNSTSGGSAGKNNSTSEAHIPPLLGVAPLGPAQLTVEHELQFKMLQAAFFHMPHPSDSERLRLHLPRQPCQTPLYYPQVWDPSSSSNPSVISFFRYIGEFKTAGLSLLLQDDWFYKHCIYSTGCYSRSV